MWQAEEVLAIKKNTLLRSVSQDIYSVASWAHVSVHLLRICVNFGYKMVDNVGVRLKKILYL